MGIDGVSLMMKKEFWVNSVWILSLCIVYVGNSKAVLFLHVDANLINLTSKCLYAHILDSY